jgi:hypothetical protein
VVDDARPPYQSARDCSRKLVQYAQERPLPFYHWLRRLAAERLALAHRRHVKVATCSVCLERLPKSDTSDRPNALLDRLAASGTSNDENGDRIGPDPMATALADELASGRLAPALMVWARQRRSRLAG